MPDSREEATGRLLILADLIAEQRPPEETPAFLLEKSLKRVQERGNQEEEANHED
jgi:hypothetical protein